jgi:hypothetical protein
MSAVGEAVEEDTSSSDAEISRESGDGDAEALGSNPTLSAIIN